MTPVKPAPTVAGNPVRTLQIIVLALLLGTTTFLGVVLFVRIAGGKPLAPLAGPGLVSLLGLGIALVNGVLAIVVPRMVERNGLAKLDSPADGRTATAGDREAALGQLYQAKTIVGVALLEGTVFFQLVALLIEGWAPSLVVALLLMAGILAHLPTAGRFAGWQEGVARLARDEAAVRGLRR